MNDRNSQRPARQTSQLKKRQVQPGDAELTTTTSQTVLCDIKPTCISQPSPASAMRQAVDAIGEFQHMMLLTPETGPRVPAPHDSTDWNLAQAEFEKCMGNLVATIDERIEVADLSRYRAALVRRLREDFSEAQRGKQYEAGCWILAAYRDKTLDEYACGLTRWADDLVGKRGDQMLTTGEGKVWNALKDRLMSISDLESSLGIATTVLRNHICAINKKPGHKILNKRGLGYFRPDAPPPDDAQPNVTAP